MGDQPQGTVPAPPEDAAPEPEPEHGHVRTAGETDVDDAIGGADDPH
jgi:hypothetical protein